MKRLVLFIALTACSFSQAYTRAEVEKTMPKLHSKDSKHVQSQCEAWAKELLKGHESKASMTSLINECVQRNS